jgi:hypothetical protein
MNPLKLSAIYKKLEDARKIADEVGKRWWLEWKSNGGSGQSDLNAACRKLDELAPGEGARVESSLALNASVDLLRKFTELQAELKDVRARLNTAEVEIGKNIVRSADTPSEGRPLFTSGGEGI